MKRNEIAEKAKAGMFVIYNDGRPGHVGVRGEILDILDGNRGMRVQFEDRARPDVIFFNKSEWMDFLTLA
jgi:hypothetical protein